MLRVITKPSFFLPVLSVFATSTNVQCRMVGHAQSVHLAPQLAMNHAGLITDVGITARATAAMDGPGATYLNLFDPGVPLATHPNVCSTFFRYLVHTTFSRKYGSFILLSGIVERSRVILPCDPDLQTRGSPDVIAFLCAALDRVPVRQVYVWSGPPLTDQELMRGQFPGDHWVGSAPPWARPFW